MRTDLPMKLYWFVAFGWLETGKTLWGHSPHPPGIRGGFPTA